MHTTNWCSSLCLTIGIYKITMSKSSPVFPWLFIAHIDIYKLYYRCYLSPRTTCILHIYIPSSLRTKCSVHNSYGIVGVHQWCTRWNVKSVWENERRMMSIFRLFKMTTIQRNVHYCCGCWFFFLLLCTHCNKTQTLLHHKKQPSIKVDIN